MRLEKEQEIPIINKINSNQMNWNMFNKMEAYCLNLQRINCQ